MSDCACGRSPGEEVMERRLNTRYVHDESNWMTSCRKCFEEMWADYDDLWGNCDGGSPFPTHAPKDDDVRQIAYTCMQGQRLMV